MRFIIAANPNNIEKIENKIFEKEIQETETFLDDKAYTVNDVEKVIDKVFNKFKDKRSKTKILDCYQEKNISNTGKKIEKECYFSPFPLNFIIDVLGELNTLLKDQINTRNAPTSSFNIFFKEAISIINNKIVNFEVMRYEERAAFDLKVIIPNLFREMGYYSDSSFQGTKGILLSFIRTSKYPSKLSKLVIETYEYIDKLISSKPNKIITKSKFEMKSNINDNEIHSDNESFLIKNLTHSTDLEPYMIANIVYGKSKADKSSTLFLIENKFKYIISALYDRKYLDTHENVTTDLVKLIKSDSKIYNILKNINLDQAKTFLQLVTRESLALIKNHDKYIKNIPFNNFEELIDLIKKINSFIKNTRDIGLDVYDDEPSASEEAMSNEHVKVLCDLLVKKYKKAFRQIDDNTNLNFFKDLNKIIVKDTSIKKNQLLTSFLFKFYYFHSEAIKLYLKYCLCGKDINWLKSKLNPYIDLSIDFGEKLENIVYTLNSYGNEKVFLIREFAEFYSSSKIQETKVDAFWNNLSDYIPILHSSSNENNTIDKIIKILVSTNVKIDSKPKKDFFTYFANPSNDIFSNIPDKDIIKRCNVLKVNFTDLKNQRDFYNNLFDNLKIVGSADSKFSEFFKTTCSISAMEAFEEYIDLKKPKQKELFNLNFKTSDYSFDVLDDNSVDYFKVGIETNCCQSLGSPGENAAIDSFINPLAGVLVLNDKNNNLLAQSYFHYVPEDNGFILDNVEKNKTNVKKANLDLNLAYAELGKYLKDTYKINYFRCGLAYNKLDSNRFTISSDKDDKRHFEYDEYSDYDHNRFLDLLSTNKPANKPTNKPKSKKLQPSNPIIKTKLDERKQYIDYKNTKQDKPLTQKLPIKSLSSSLLIKLFSKYGIM